MHIQLYKIVQMHIFKLSQHTAFFFYYTVNRFHSSALTTHSEKQVNDPRPLILLKKKTSPYLKLLFAHTKFYAITTETAAQKQDPPHRSVV